LLLAALGGVRQAVAVLAHVARPAALCWMRCSRTLGRYAVNHLRDADWNSRGIGHPPGARAEEKPCALHWLEDRVNRSCGAWYQAVIARSDLTAAVRRRRARGAPHLRSRACAPAPAIR
jgi:hypothetical protein